MPLAPRSAEDHHTSCNCAHVVEQNGIEKHAFAERRCINLGGRIVKQPGMVHAVHEERAYEPHVERQIRVRNVHALVELIIVKKIYHAKKRSALLVDKIE